MTLEEMTTVLLVALLVFLGFLALRRIQAPGARTQRLAMTIWSAYGPYETEESASNFLRAASRSVFGRKGCVEHEAWVERHISNFRNWESQGSFQRMQRFMRFWLQLCAYGPAFNAACKQFREYAEADLKKSVKKMNKVLMKGGQKIETVKESDGTASVRMKQI